MEWGGVGWGGLLLKPIPVFKGGGGEWGTSKNAIYLYMFFLGGGVAHFNCGPQPPTLFWDGRSVWWPLKARKQQFLGSVVIFLAVFEPGTSFWRGPRATNVLVGVSPFEHSFLGPSVFHQPPLKSATQNEISLGYPPLKLQLVGGNILKPIPCYKFGLVGLAVQLNRLKVTTNGTGWLGTTFSSVDCIGPYNPGRFDPIAKTIAYIQPTDYTPMKGGPSRGETQMLLRLLKENSGKVTTMSFPASSQRLPL